MENTDIQNLRTDYTLHSLSEGDVEKDPIAQFDTWMQQAITAKVMEANAMCLSSIDGAGFPQARIVLLRGFSEQGFVFYTNYESEKGQNLLANASCGLTFFWPELERQVRITGTASKLSAEQSDAYFKSRPRSSQLGAWASPQSKVIKNRHALEELEGQYAKQFEGQDVPRPAHWGGFCVSPIRIEFWQGRASRLHDRLVYEKNEPGQWLINRLAP